MLSLTAIEIIRQARLALGSLGDGIVISAEEAQDDLLTLNILLAELSVHGNLIYADESETKTLTAGTASYTWGAGGNITTTRPIALRDETFIRQDNVDYPVSLIGSGQYNGYCDKDLTSTRPLELFFESSFPLAKVYFYPIPDQAYVVHFTAVKELTTLTGITTTISMPPEFLSAIKWNLAVALAPNYNLPISPLVLGQAERSMNVIKRMIANHRLETMRQGLFDDGGNTYLAHIEAGP